jgi:hypothetical protein
MTRAQATREYMRLVLELCQLHMEYPDVPVIAEASRIAQCQASKQDQLARARAAGILRHDHEGDQ